MSGRCPNCSQTIKHGVPTTQCDGCRADVHSSCVGLSSDDIRITRTKSRCIKIICNSCNRFMGELGEMKNLMSSIREDFNNRFSVLEQKFNNCFLTDFTTLKDSMDKLYKDFNDFKSTSLPVPSLADNATNGVFDEALQEFSERQKRKNNIMIFGVPEIKSNIKDERIAADKMAISYILSSSGLAIDTSKAKIFRLGGFQNNKTRPIKVVLEREDHVHQVLRSIKNLKSMDQFKSIVISSDRTPKQIDQYRQLKLELNERVKKGEQNLKIKYVNGTPRIVSLNR